MQVSSMVSGFLLPYLQIGGIQEVFSGDFQARTDSFDGLYAELTSPTGCDPVVQRGIFGLITERNDTNYREPAFQIVGIVVKIK